MKRTEDTSQIERYIALDIHKEYVLAGGQNAKQEWVLPPRRISMAKFREWAVVNLRAGDAVALEMTTNTWHLYDELVAYAGSVMVVHPPHVALITRSQVMNDKIAASILARLLAKGLLVGIWIPPQEIREARGLAAQRQKMVRLATQAKNRLHAVIQRHHLKPPVGNPFKAGNKEWWQSLPLGKFVTSVCTLCYICVHALLCTLCWHAFVVQDSTYFEVARESKCLISSRLRYTFQTAIYKRTLPFLLSNRGFLLGQIKLRLLLLILQVSKLQMDSLLPDL